MKPKKSYCFEIYRVDVPDNATGLLRLQCFEGETLNETVTLLHEFIAEKYEFQTYWLKR